MPETREETTPWSQAYMSNIRPVKVKVNKYIFYSLPSKYKEGLKDMVERPVSTA